MSRRKRSIPLTSQIDINHLRSASRRLGDVDLEFQQIQQRLDEFRLERLQDLSIAEDNYQSQVQSSFDSYDDQLETIQTRTNHLITAQVETLQKNNEYFQNQLWDQAAGYLEEQSTWLEETFEQNRADQQTRIEQLQNELLAVQQNIQHRQDFACQTIRDAGDLLDHLDSQFKSEPQWQAVLPGVRLELQHTQSNLNNGFEEAALAGAQILFQHLIDLQANLEAFVQQRQTSIDQVMELAENVVECIDRNSRVQCIDMEGNPLPIDLDVDFWTCGQFKTFLLKAQSVLHQVRQPPFLLRLDEIEYFKNILVEIQDQIPEVIFQARLQVLSSQMRFNIAECVLNALRTQGYELDFGRYAGSDMRSAYNLMLQNLGGSQVFATVSPVTEQPFIQNLDLETNEQKVFSEYEIRQRAKELDSALSLFGLKVGQIASQVPVFIQNSMSQRPSGEAPSWVQTDLQRSFQH